jgi:hypothetical protein
MMKEYFYSLKAKELRGKFILLEEASVPELPILLWLLF